MSVRALACVCVSEMRVCIHLRDRFHEQTCGTDAAASAVSRGGVKVHAAHPRFESALNVPDAPLGVTLGLGNTHKHTHASRHVHRLLIKNVLH